MKLKNEFISQKLGDEQILVPIGVTTEAFRGIVRLNETASFIVNCLKEEITEEEIIEKLLKEYDVGREVATVDIRKVIETLTNINALE